MRPTTIIRISVLSASISFFSCNDEEPLVLSKEVINDLDLKRGELISCGNPNSKFGTVAFSITGKKTVRDDFNLGVKLLHSFEYDEAEKVFARIIDEDPNCAMAYWGVAMSNFHPLWTPPMESELIKGSKALELSKSIKKSEREEEYINAISTFYKDWKTVDHKTRCQNFEKAMEKLNSAYPDDKETAIFYALSLNAAADPADKTFTKQKKAGEILNKLYAANPDHPGVVHYLIHTFDSPELADNGLNAATKYASVAPSSAHALHMPSHIFTRLGLWNDCINSNIASMNAAQCYAESAGIKGHWDEEIHALDYLVYAYLQKGDNTRALAQVNYSKGIETVSPYNFKVAYSFASIPSRYLLENKLWKEAASLEIVDRGFSWDDYPWQKAILHFTRSLGASNTGDVAAAKKEVEELKKLQQKLITAKDNYKANQVLIQIKSSEAWVKYKEGKNEEALATMKEAVDLEDKTEKHPVTPGEVLPARQLLGDLLFAMGKTTEALEAYESDLKKHPNRFNSLYGAGLAAEKSGNNEKANTYYQQLLKISEGRTEREELKIIKGRL